MTSLRLRSGLAVAGLLLCQCGGSARPAASQQKVYAPEDMPDICQDIDFNQAGADIKKECGVQTRNYRAYRNIPEHRNLLLPKGAKIVRKGKGMELRLTSTLPIELPADLEGKILFDEKLRRTFIKDKMDYCEFFPEHASERLRIMRLDIPLDVGGSKSVCYTVGSRPTTAQRKAGYAGRLELLDCADFDRLKAIAQTQNGGKESGEAAEGNTPGGEPGNADKGKGQDGSGR